MKEEKVEKKNFVIHFDSIYVNETVQNSFKAFLKTEINDGPLNFLMDVKKLETLKKTKEKVQLLHEIVENYLKTDSKDEINISGKLKEEILSEFEAQKNEFEELKLKKTPEEFFEPVSKVIGEELYFDSWKRFIRSKFCDEIISKFYQDKSVCSPQIVSQFDYSDDYFNDPFLRDQDFEFAKLLLQDNFAWEVNERHFKQI
jgi:hypothetical protein